MTVKAPVTVQLGTGTCAPVDELPPASAFPFTITLTPYEIALARGEELPVRGDHVG
jgi:hypothetical protein